MKKSAYKNTIKKACQALGTYDEAYDLAIDKLADILEEYDEARDMVAETGRFVEHTNKAGATNLDLSPAAVTMRQCRTDALPYMKELGLTPAGIKKIGQQPKEDNVGLIAALAKLGG